MIDFADFKLSPDPNDYITINLNLKNMVKHTFEPIDRCCTAKKKLLKFDGIDNMNRISCDISKDDFTKDFINKRRPVILTGCQRHWKASNWTINSLLLRYHEMNWPISCYYNIKGNCFSRNVDKDEMMHLLTRNVPLKTFVKIPKSLRGQLENG